MSSARFNFDEAAGPASARASVLRQCSLGPRHQSHPMPVSSYTANTGCTSVAHLAPPFDFGGGSRSASTTSVGGWQPTAGTYEDTDAVGSLLDRWGAAHRTGTTASYQSDPALHNNANYRNPQPVGRCPISFADVERSSMEHTHRRIIDEGCRLEQLEEEETRLAAEERALTVELREVNARHRSIDAAMFSMQQEWSELHASERALRLEPIVDLSLEIAHAEGTLEAVRRRVQGIEARYETVSAQLKVADQVDAHKAGQLKALDDIGRSFNELNTRRLRAIDAIHHQSAVDAARRRIVEHAACLLEAAERALSVKRVQGSRGSMPPTDPVQVPAAAPPALKGSRLTNNNYTTSAAAPPARLALAPRSEADAPPLSCKGSSCSAPRSAAVSFAIDLDGDDAVAEEAEEGLHDPVSADDITGTSFAFPSVATLLGAKRTRLEVTAA